jgi:hypothetical protein
MQERDWLERIDGHLARANELFDRNNVLFDRNIEALDRNIEAFDRNIEALDRVDEELRLSRLARERSDDATERLFAAFARLTKDVAARYDSALHGFETAVSSLERKIDDSIDESKAHRGALLAILERLGPDGSSAAA